jgi:hypothetical protein
MKASPPIWIMPPQCLPLRTRQHPERPKILGLQVGDTASEDQRLELHGVLFTKPALAERTIGALLLSNRDRTAEQIAIELPGAAQLEMARVSQIRSLQHQIAGVVVKSVTAICGAIGAQPIPLADFPILTSLQASMVASIAHVSRTGIQREAGSGVSRRARSQYRGRACVARRGKSSREACARLGARDQWWRGGSWNLRDRTICRGVLY